MNNIVINNVTYHLPVMCCQLTIAQAQLIAELHKALTTTKQPLNITQSRRVLIEICCVDRKTANATHKKDIIAFASILIEHLYCILLTPDEGYNKNNKRSFKLEGESLLFPRNGETLEGEVIPMDNITTEQMCDATDLYIADAFKYAPLIIAILCLPKNEHYNPKLIRKRAVRLKQMKTNIALRIFSHLDAMHEYAKEVFPNCYGTSVAQVSKGGVISLSWNDLLLITANHTPSEIKLLSQMNCYDFLQIANSKNRLNKRYCNA